MIENPVIAASSPATAGQSPSANLRSQRTRPWLIVVGLLFVAVAGYPAWKWNVEARQMSLIRQALAQSNFPEAIKLLESAVSAKPQDAELTYQLAVAHRRAGHLNKFDEYLKQAGSLGCPPADMRRQMVLVRMQMGLVDEQMEEDAGKLLEELTERNVPSDVEEYYEARTLGYLANLRLNDAELAISHWLEFNPSAIGAKLLRGDVLERQTRTIDAEKEYAQLVTEWPQCTEARVNYGRMLLLSLKVSEAEEQYRYCEERLDHDPRVELGLAECQLRSGNQTQGARERLERLLATTPAAPQRSKALQLLSEIARADKDYSRLLELTLEAIKTSPTDAGLYQNLASAYSALQRREDAQKALDSAKKVMEFSRQVESVSSELQADPENADLRYQEGKLFYDVGMKEEAFSWWVSAVRYDPNHLASHESLMGYYQDKGDEARTQRHRRMVLDILLRSFDDAWKDLWNERLVAARKKAESYSRYPELRAYADLLLVGLDIKEWKNQETLNSRLIPLTRIPAVQSKALVLAGEAAYRAGQFADAETILFTVLRANPNDVNAHRVLGELNNETRAFANASFHYRKITELDKADYRAYLSLAFIEQQVDHFRDAIEYYEESLRRKPDQPKRSEALVQLAECYFNLNEFDKSLKVLADAGPSAHRDVVEAECLYATRKVKEAREILDRTLAEDTKNLPGLMLRANIATLDNDLPSAEKFLRLAVDFRPGYATAHSKLAGVLQRLGKKEEAKQHADKAADLTRKTLRLQELQQLSYNNPDDVGVRREGAAIARELQIPDLAKLLDQAADAIESKKKSGVAPQPRILTVPEAIDDLQTPVKLETAPAQSSKKEGESKGGGGCNATELQPSESEQEAKNEVFSGPQVGEKMGDFVFKPILGGAKEETKDIDPVKEAGGKPTLIVFVHSVTRPSVGLARVLGTYAASRKKDGLQTAVVFLTADATETEAWIKRASGALPKDVPVGYSPDGQEGPGAYGLNRKVTVTVLVAKAGKVTANFALVQPSVQADAPKILEEVVKALGSGKVPPIEELLGGREMPARERPKRGEQPKPEEKPKGDPKPRAPEVRRDQAPAGVR